MKKIMFTLLILGMIPLLTGCTANVVGKFDNYDEIFTGTLDIDVMSGQGIMKIKSTPNNITCKGTRWITYIPLTSYLLGMCKGQKGEIELSCDDGRIIKGDWVCESCTRTSGEGKTNLNENITFYTTMSSKGQDKKLEEYRSSATKNPDLKGKNYSNGNILEDLF